MKQYVDSGLKGKIEENSFELPLEFEPGELVTKHLAVMNKTENGNMANVYTGISCSVKTDETSDKLTKLQEVIHPYSEVSHLNGLIERELMEIEGRTNITAARKEEIKAELKKLKEKLNANNSEIIPVFNDKYLWNIIRNHPELNKEDKTPSETVQTDASSFGLVALKVIPLLKKVKEEERAGTRLSFQREVGLHKRLSHPNIPKIYYDLEKGDKLMYASEFIDGFSLESLLSDDSWRVHGEQHIPVYVALIIAKQIAGALNYAIEEREVMHLDTWPGNIMLDHRAKIIDWGKAVDAYSGKKFLEKVGGKHQYMSPEVIGNVRVSNTSVYLPDEKTVPFNKKSPVFSLGGILYHMLTNNLAYNGTDASSTKTLILANQIINPKVLFPKEFTDDEIKLVYDLLKTYPEQRPSTGEAEERLDELIQARIRTGDRYYQMVGSKLETAAISFMLSPLYAKARKGWSEQYKPIEQEAVPERKKRLRKNSED